MLFSGGKLLRKNLCFANKKRKTVDGVSLPRERQEVLKAYVTGRGRTRNAVFGNEMLN